MQKILFAMVIMSVSGLILSTPALADKIDQRQLIQHQKISQGISSGQLTLSEAHHLWQEQQKIQQIKKSFRRDGRLNLWEKMHLVLLLDRADRHIFQLKHNSRRKPAIWQRASYQRHQRVW